MKDNSLFNNVIKNKFFKEITKDLSENDLKKIEEALKGYTEYLQENLVNPLEIFSKKIEEDKKNGKS